MPVQTPTKNIQVSIVEDSIDLCRTLEMMINATPGMSCLSTHYNGESALDKIPDHPPDIVLIDLGLPKMSGIEVISKLKEPTQALQFLVLTIQDNDEGIFGSESRGQRLSTKNSSPSEIIESITELYDGGAPMSADIARKVVSSKLEKRRRVHMNIY
jgi:DNA-binding NarL/FixJ family response regulator